MYFQSCKDLKEGRELYRKLLMQHHPERGGNEEDFKQVTIQFEHFLRNVPFEQFASQHHRDWQPKAEYSDAFYAALAAVMAMNVEVEVIGSWIHVRQFRGFELKLVALGFWWSYGHKAMIWSGDEKKHKKPYYTTEGLRRRFGAEKKRDKMFFNGDKAGKTDAAQPQEDEG